MPSSEKSKCCGAYVTRRFFMPCHSCACLMGGLCTAVYVVRLNCSLVRGEIGTFRGNLSAAAYMDYTSSAIARTMVLGLYT